MKSASTTPGGRAIRARKASCLPARLHPRTAPRILTRACALPLSRSPGWCRGGGCGPSYLDWLIYRTSHPHGAVLGQVPGTEAYRNRERHPEALTFPGLLIWRPGGDLFFASIGHLGDRLKAALAASRPPAKHVLLDAESVNLIDSTACDALLNIIQELQSQGITFAFDR